MTDPRPRPPRAFSAPSRSCPLARRRAGAGLGGGGGRGRAGGAERLPAHARRRRQGPFYLDPRPGAAPTSPRGGRARRSGSRCRWSTPTAGRSRARGSTSGTATPPATTRACAQPRRAPTPSARPSCAARSSPTRAASRAFATIWPGWYRGRTPHVHYKVFLDDADRADEPALLPGRRQRGGLPRRGAYARAAARRTPTNASDGIARRAGRAALAQVTGEGVGDGGGARRRDRPGRRGEAGAAAAAPGGRQPRLRRWRSRRSAASRSGSRPWPCSPPPRRLPPRRRGSSPHGQMHGGDGEAAVGGRDGDRGGGRDLVGRQPGLAEDARQRHREAARVRRRRSAPRGSCPSRRRSAWRSCSARASSTPLSVETVPLPSFRPPLPDGRTGSSSCHSPFVLWASQAPTLGEELGPGNRARRSGDGPRSWPSSLRRLRSACLAPGGSAGRGGGARARGRGGRWRRSRPAGRGG